MGSYILNGGNIAGILYTTIAIHDEDRTVLANPRIFFNYQNRTPQSCRDFMPFASLWPRPQMMNGDPTTRLALLGSNDAGGKADAFEPWSLGESGYYRPYFVYGSCIDAGGLPVAGATIDLFLTASDLKVSTTISDDGGNYQAPTIYIGQQHYIVAYLAGSPDVAGTTINTLTPSQ